VSSERAASEASARRAAPPPPRKQQVSARDRYLPVLISVLSTAVVFGGAAYVITSAPEWPRIRQQFFSLEAMQAAFPRVWVGFLLNMRMWVIALVFIAIWALLLAVMRSLDRALGRTAAGVRRRLHRPAPRGAVPAAGAAVRLRGPGAAAARSAVEPPLLGDGRSRPRVRRLRREVYRSGMEAVHDGQRAAAKALGLTQWQTLRYAIIPQAIRNVLPALLNLAVALQKDVALLSVIGVRDAVREAQIYTARTFNYSSLVVAALLFLLATIPMARLTDWVARRDQERRLQRTL
jgi:polar amino acid transport system permease protein